MTTIAVPIHTLQRLLRLADEGVHPKIYWNISREKMDSACIAQRGERLQQIQEELENIIPEDRRRP